MNPGGVRADLVPAASGAIQYGDIFSAQPFGNGLVVTTLTGKQLRAVLEQQFASGQNSAEEPRILLPSEGFRFGYDLSRPAGERIVAMSLDGRPIDDLRDYRVTINSFLASGGDNFTLFAQGRDRVDAGVDLDALERYLGRGIAVPRLGRIRNETPEAAIRR